MSLEEYNDLMSTGKFRSISTSNQGKWFAENVRDAETWGKRFIERGWENRPFKIVEVEVDSGIAATFFREQNLDKIGPARFAELDQINAGIISIREVTP